MISFYDFSYMSHDLNGDDHGHDPNIFQALNQVIPLNLQSFRAGE